MRTNNLSRRTLPHVYRGAALGLARSSGGSDSHRIGGISVRDELAKDPQGTVRAAAAMGYQGLTWTKQALGQSGSGDRERRHASRENSYSACDR